MRWERTTIVTDEGTPAEALAPVIISASRSTDIPGCHADWFMKRFLDHGYVVRTDPFNRARSCIGFGKTRAIVFWTKDPRPLMPKLKLLDERGIGYYFQFTLNDYEGLGYEPNLPPLEERIADFRELSRAIGKERVVWRFDPLLLSDRLDLGPLMERVERVGDRVHRYTDRLVFSFVDLKTYRKLARPAKEHALRELSGPEMDLAARRLSEKNREWGLELFTCGEKVPLERYGIRKGRCIDGDLLRKLFPRDEALQAFLERNNKKDAGQREACGCIPSKDIGEYDTCPHFCVYCYANRSGRAVMENLNEHGRDPFGETVRRRSAAASAPQSGPLRTESSGKPSR